MVGLYAEHSGTFLRTLAVLTAVVFSIPILVAPLAWARAFAWKVEPDSDLALYFGRCLGGFALVFSGCAWYVVGHPVLEPFFFSILILVFTLMAIIHAVGAVQKVQPWTETAEIAFWCLLVALGVLFHPGAPTAVQ